MFSVQQMEHFISVAEERSFSEAARKRHISQQTLSICIAQMEAEIGATLFERTRPLTITSAGKKLLEGSKEILRVGYNLDRELSEMTSPGHDTIKIGLSFAHAHSTMIPILNEFIQKMPNVKILIKELNFEFMSQALINGVIDIALVRQRYVTGNVEYLQLVECDNMYLYAPARTLKRYFGDRAEDVKKALSENIDLSIFRGVPVCMPEKGTIRSFFDEYLESRHLDLRIQYETTSLETCINMAAAGNGITVFPGRLLLLDEDAAVPTYYNGDDSYLLKKGDYSVALGLAMLPNVKMSEAASLFIKTVQNSFKEREAKEELRFSE